MVSGWFRNLLADSSCWLICIMENQQYFSEILADSAESDIGIGQFRIYTFGRLSTFKQKRLIRSFIIEWNLRRYKPQWYMVLNKRVQWVFFDNILTNWFYNFSSIPNKSFCGLVVRRPAFHTEIWGSIPLAGSFVFFLVFFRFFSSFSKKGLSLGLCSSKAINTHW